MCSIIKLWDNQMSISSQLFKRNSVFSSKFSIEIKAEYIPSKQNHLADLCSRAFSNNMHFRNFNKLLSQGTLILENVYYDKFNFEYVI